MNNDELRALLSRVSAETGTPTSAEDLANHLGCDTRQLLGQVTRTRWWQIRRRRYIKREVRLNQEFIHDMQQVVGRQLLH